MLSRSEFRSYTEAFLRLIYPSFCGLCPATLEVHEQGVCGTCSEKLQSLRFSFPDMLRDEKIASIRETWSLYAYESPLKELLAAVKFLDKRWLLKEFRAQIKEAAAFISAEDRYDCIIPVPMDRGRFMERQFNQAEILASFVSQSTGISSHSWLRKSFSTPAQSGLSQEERRFNLLGTFRLSHSAAVTGKNILLVDDIVTTGATASEAANLLKGAGAKSVSLLTLARTERHFPFFSASETGRDRAE